MRVCLLSTAAVDENWICQSRRREQKKKIRIDTRSSLLRKNKTLSKCKKYEAFNGPNEPKFADVRTAK